MELMIGTGDFKSAAFNADKSIIANLEKIDGEPVLSVVDSWNLTCQAKCTIQTAARSLFSGRANLLSGGYIRPPWFVTKYVKSSTPVLSQPRENSQISRFFQKLFRFIVNSR